MGNSFIEICHVSYNSPFKLCNPIIFISCVHICTDLCSHQSQPNLEHFHRFKKKLHTFSYARPSPSPPQSSIPSPSHPVIQNSVSTDVPILDVLYKYVVFYDCPLSLSIMFSRYIHVVACVNTSFLLVAGWKTFLVSRFEFFFMPLLNSLKWDPDKHLFILAFSGFSENILLAKFYHSNVFCTSLILSSKNVMHKSSKISFWSQSTKN